MQKNWWQHQAVGLICCIISPSLFASSIFPDNFFKTVSWHPIMVFTAGSALNSDAGESKNFPATSKIFTFYNYTADNPTQKYALFGAFLGAEFLLQPAWSLQAGLSYYQPSAFIAKGIVTQGADLASANQYSYQYLIQAHQLLVEGKLLYNWKIYHPYFSAGIGPSFNYSQDYSVNIQPPFTTFSNQFANRNVTSFSYNVGVGVDMDVTDHARFGVGYRFTDFGSSQTGNANIDGIATSNNFSQSHLYANELLAQFTFDLA